MARYRISEAAAADLDAIWLYVAVTGVIIYLMLYHMPPPGGGSPGVF